MVMFMMINMMSKNKLSLHIMKLITYHMPSNIYKLVQFIFGNIN